MTIIGLLAPPASSRLRLRSRRGFRDQSGQALLEYAIIIALVAVALGAALLLLRDAVGGVYGRTGNQIEQATSASSDPASETAAPSDPASGSAGKSKGKGKGCGDGVGGGKEAGGCAVGQSK